MVSPTNILSEEHQNILKVIDALTAECQAMQSGKGLDKVFFEKAVDFIKNYADRFHHAKEEDILFAELDKDSVHMPCNPVQQMLYEHGQGRAFVRGLEAGLKTGNKKRIVESALGYAELLREHIYKEDHILYPMANMALTQNVKNAIMKKFRAVESKSKSSKYVLFVKELEKQKCE